MDYALIVCTMGAIVWGFIGLQRVNPMRLNVDTARL